MLKENTDKRIYDPMINPNAHTTMYIGEELLTHTACDKEWNEAVTAAALKGFVVTGVVHDIETPGTLFQLVGYYLNDPAKQEYVFEFFPDWEETGHICINRALLTAMDE